MNYYISSLCSDALLWCALLVPLVAWIIKRLSEVDVPCLDTAISKVHESQDPFASFACPQPEFSFAAALRSNQLLRYLDDHIFEDFLSILDRVDIGRGERVRNLDQWGFCVVGTGEVEIRLINNASGDDQLRTSTVFHRSREGDSLLPMCTILGVLLEALHNEASPDTTSGLSAFTPTGHFQDCFEVVASEDVQLYAAKRPRMKQWMLDQRQSSTHVFGEILRRFFCVTAPICITYMGLEIQWSTLMIKLSATSQTTRQSTVLQMASTIAWLREALDNRCAGNEPGKVSRVVLSGMENSVISPRGSSNMLSHIQRQSPKPKDTPVPRSSGRSTPLRLQISPFGHGYGENHTRDSPLHTAEKHSSLQKELLRYDHSFAYLLRQDIARQILRKLSGGDSSQLGSHTVWSDDYIESLSRQCAQDIEVVYFAKDAVIVPQGRRYPGVIFVIDGKAALRDKKLAVTNATIGPSNLFGTECLLPENKSAFEVVADTETFVGILPRAKAYELGTRHPLLIYYLGQRLITNLPKLLGLADFAIGWKQYNAGHMISEHIKSGGFSIVLHGKFRMRVPIISGGHYVREVPAGKSLGIPEMFLKEQNSRDILCLRKSELATIQTSAYEALALFEPKIALTVTRIVASNAAAAEGELIQRNLAAENEVASPKTIAILTLSSTAPVELFTAQLVRAIIDTGLKSASSIAVLNSDHITSAIGGGVFDSAGNVRLESYIGQIEENAEVTLLVGDVSPRSTWNKACIAHADAIIFVAMADDSPKISEMDTTLLEVGTQSEIHLALLHEHSGNPPVGVTSAWLQPRRWIKGGRHHLKMSNSVLKLSTPGSNPRENPSADFQRLARRLFRRSIALVLGGGGARGLGHVGFIKAMEERGIPVDIVGGSSMGACVAGVLARDLTAAATYDGIKTMNGSLRISHFIPDLTYPYLAKSTGSFFQKMLRDLFGNATFNDLWLECYCAVTNVTKDCVLQTVRHGSLSTSIGASMSYLGAVPPTCMDGDLWIDSCYSGNLPARLARELGAETIFVVDVSRMNPLSSCHYGSTISGWQILVSSLKNYLPSSLHVPVSLPPSSSMINDRLTVGTSNREAEAVKNIMGCYYIRLPLRGYTPRSFHKFEELVQEGYQAGKAWFDEQEALQNLPVLAVPRHTLTEKQDI